MASPTARKKARRLRRERLKALRVATHKQRRKRARREKPGDQASLGNRSVRLNDGKYVRVPTAEAAALVEEGKGVYTSRSAFRKFNKAARKWREEEVEKKAA